MVGAYFTPLAPAAILLLSAFILPVVMPRLPASWFRQSIVVQFSAPALVGLAGFSLLGIRLATGRSSTGAGLEFLSGWNFSTTESVAALTVRADPLSLLFLIVTLLLLLAITLLRFETSNFQAQLASWTQLSGWLLLGAAVCFLVVAANGLTLAYGAMIFDTVMAVYWLRRDHPGLGVARLFLGILTGAALMLATLVPTSGLISGLWLLGLALWLRVGLYPYIEATTYPGWRQDDRPAFLALSLLVAFYLTIRVVDQPLPEAIHWPIALTMLLSGLLVWLLKPEAELGEGTDSLPHPQGFQRHLLPLVWLFLTEGLLILLVAPLQPAPALSFVVGLLLSLVALWGTPALGRPRLKEGAWSWPYLPAVAATVTLVGLPFSLGWIARSAIYQRLLQYDLGLLGLALLAEALAWSGLVRYWITLGQNNELSGRRSVVGIVAMVPFLIPGLGPFVLSRLTGIELSLLSLNQPVVIGLIILLSGAAIGLDYYRDQIIARLHLPSRLVFKVLRLQALIGATERLLDEGAKIVLQARVILEGRHYMGWAIFVALLGALMIFLSLQFGI